MTPIRRIARIKAIIRNSIRGICSIRVIRG